MTRIFSFPPIENRDAAILILGSMPGIASLTAQQYYAHPQNSFWPIMAALLKFDINLSYVSKVQALKASGIAVWDVLQSCHREGSLDTNIECEVINDFESFFKMHPHIQRIFFNGAKAQTSFKKHILSHIDLPNMDLVRLPSTSPAHASLTFEQKLNAWKTVLTYETLLES
jgi:hypoxanthine-DNA glycosylase